MVQRASYKRNGGLVREEKSAKGTYLILNAQGKLSEEMLMPARDCIDKWMRVQTMLKPYKGVVNCSNTKTLIKEAGGTLGVAVVDVETLPAFLVAPEEGWALVNVHALEDGCSSDEVLASRVRKELLRAYVMVAGGVSISHGAIVMRDVKSPRDLDLIPRECFGLEVVNHIVSTSSFYGVTPWRQASYRKACIDGWAPAPTNDVQKAIWNEIHSMPTSPIKILPESSRRKTK
jgi:hypothetical protein